MSDNTVNLDRFFKGGRALVERSAPAKESNSPYAGVADREEERMRKLAGLYGVKAVYFLQF